MEIDIYLLSTFMMVMGILGVIIMDIMQPCYSTLTPKMAAVIFISSATKWPYWGLRALLEIMCLILSGIKNTIVYFFSSSDEKMDIMLEAIGIHGEHAIQDAFYSYALHKNNQLT